MDPKDEIKAKIDIVELIGEYLDLKKVGGGSFRCVCPFHQEKTPSCYVSSEKQIWHCFGCGEGGDIFSFLMKMDGVDFPEALRILGKKTGVEIQRFSSSHTNEKQRLFQLNQLVAKFFSTILEQSPKAALARKYVEARGIPSHLASEFRLGYAPDTWDALSLFLQKKGWPIREAVQAGLVLPKKSGVGFIDRFRHRLMIPLCDMRGDIVGFTGRAMRKEDEPKYLNSPESFLYKKGEVLFGLSLAKQAIRETGTVILVEGNLDVIASHKAGVKNIVASSGTALTESQLLLIKRFTNHLLFCFDQDKAGFQAAIRGMRLAREKEFRLDVIFLPPEKGKDPDEIIQKDPELWKKLVNQTIPAMEYLLKQLLHGRNLQDVQQKVEVSHLFLQELRFVPDVVEREHWLRVISDVVQTPKEELRAYFLKTFFSDSASLSPRSSKTDLFLKKTGKSEKAAETVLAVLLQDNQETKDLFADLQPEMLPQGMFQIIGKAIQSWYTFVDESSAQKSLFFGICESFRQHAQEKELISFVQALAMSGEKLSTQLSTDQVREQFTDALKVLKQEHLRQQREALERQIRQAESAGDTKTVEQLLKTYQELRSTIF